MNLKSCVNYPIDHGKIRKLSVTVSLNDPSEYDGGNLEFDFRNQIDWERNRKAKIKECVEIRPRGSIIVFPCFVLYKSLSKYISPSSGLIIPTII